MVQPRRLTLKVLCPEGTIGNFLGVDVNGIQQQTNTDIGVSKQGEYFPGKSQERVVSISGFSIGSISEVFDLLQDAIDKKGGRGPGKPSCILASTNDAAGQLLGAGGSRVSTLTLQYPKMNVNIQPRNMMDQVVKERFIEIKSIVANFKHVRSVARQVIEIICGANNIQPLHNQVYIRSSSDVESGTDSYKTTNNHLRDTIHARDAMSCTVIDGNTVKHFKGGKWVEDPNYSVFSISKDRITGEPIFRKISTN